MARNQEKAAGVLNRWTSMKSELRKGPQKKREVKFASDCKWLPDAERRRRNLLNDITHKIEEIQSATLGEFKVRQLNDEINKLIKEKLEWEKQIIKLGGRNYTHQKGVVYDDEGREIPGATGYQYFGAARNLPGVRELFEATPKAPPKRKREEILQNIDHTYYGFVEKEDLELLRVEEKEEVRLRQELAEKWDRRQQQGTTGYDNVDDNDSSEDEEAARLRVIEEKKQFEEARQKELEEEKLRVEQRKKELLAKLASQ